MLEKTVFVVKTASVEKTVVLRIDSISEYIVNPAGA